MKSHAVRPKAWSPRTQQWRQNFTFPLKTTCDLFLCLASSGISPVIRILSESITSSVGPAAWSPALSWVSASFGPIGWLNQRSEVTTTLPRLWTVISHGSVRAAPVHSHKPNWSISPEGWNLTGLEEASDSTVAVCFRYLLTNKRPASDHVTSLKTSCAVTEQFFYFYSLVLLSCFLSFSTINVDDAPCIFWFSK